jgi:arginine deiminase
MANTQGATYGVHSEVGHLRKVMVCAPGRAHERLTPSNCDELLYDDVIWVETAKRDHFDFMQKMRDRGIEVVEMHNLLTQTVAIPDAKKWILDAGAGDVACHGPRNEPDDVGMHQRLASLERQIPDPAPVQDW